MAHWVARAVDETACGPQGAGQSHSASIVPLTGPKEDTLVQGTISNPSLTGEDEERLGCVQERLRVMEPGDGLLP